MRNIFAILLILASIGIYYGYTKNVFADIKTTKAQIADYDSTLNKVDLLNTEKDDLTNTINTFSQEDRDRLEKMIPDNADNVRLIIDIQNIAESNGLVIKNISVNDENKQGTQDAAATVAAGEQGISSDGTSLPYNFVTLSFTVTSTYDNYIEFLKKLEQSLRLVDITSLTIKPSAAANLYDFNITIKAYWLK